jgi:Ca-activated chloride channel homolog
MFTFANPDALLFLLAIPVMIIVHILTFSRAKTKAVVFANFEAIKRVVDAKQGLRSAVTPSRRVTLLIYRLITFSLIILSVSGTTYWYDGMVSEQDFVIAIDSSTSMLAEDVQPNRFEAAKQSATSFVNSVRGDSRIGIVTFSGTAILALRPTIDRADTRRAIENLRIRTIAGTDIASAIFLSTNELSTSNKSRTIILITDGSQTMGASLPDALEYALENEVRIYPIGIGTDEGGAFLRTNLISILDTSTLEEIAEVVGTDYLIARTAEDLDVYFADVLNLQAGRTPVPLANILMLIALALLFIEWGLINTRFRELP